MILHRIMTAIAIGSLWLALSAMNAEAKTKVTSQPFGKMPDGTAVEIFTLSDGAYEARIATYGGIVVSLKAPDRNGKPADVVLGFDDLDGYVANSNGTSASFFGAIIGRYANRIARGSFALNGQKYSLPLNNGENSLHGGPHGFNNVVWKGKPVANGVEFSYLSKDRGRDQRAWSNRRAHSSGGSYPGASHTSCPWRRTWPRSSRCRSGPAR